MTFQKLTRFRFSRGKIFFGSALVFCIFLLSGGFVGIKYYVFNEAVTVGEGRWLITAPFFAGFAFLGTLGLIQMGKYARDKSRLLLSMIYVVFSYAGIEVLYLAVGR